MSSCKNSLRHHVLQAATNPVLHSPVSFSNRLRNAFADAHPRQLEFVVPGVEHLLVQSKDAFTSHTCRRWREHGHAIVNASTVFTINTREQVPKRERVARARLVQD